QVLELIDHLYEIIANTEMPDVPALPGAQPRPAIEPLPEATYSEIIGLLEYLKARGGREDLFRIAADTNREFGRVITVVRAAELFDFVSTPRRLVVLEAPGKNFLQAGPVDRKRMWRQQLLHLHLFHYIFLLLHSQPGRQIERDFVLETMV